MKKRMRLITILITVCLIFAVIFTMPALANVKTIPENLSMGQYDGSVCSKCGKVFTGADGEQSQLAKALGLTLCMHCWLDVLYGSYRSDNISKIALLDENGILSPDVFGELPKGGGDLFLKYNTPKAIWTTPTASAAWGNVTGNITSQTDLQGVLDSKLSAITGTELDNVFSSNGLLKRTGVGTYIVDDSAYITSWNEVDPVFGQSAAYGIQASDITAWNNKIGTELDSVFTASVAHGITSANTTDWNNKLSSITGVGLDNVFSSNGLLKRTGSQTYTVDDSTYLTANQNITLSGDLSGSGTTSISGTVTGVQGKAITLATGFLKYSGSAWSFDNSMYLTGNQNISLSGDASGNGATSISVTNAGLKGVALPTLSTGYLYYSGSAWAFQTPAGGNHNLLDGSTHPDTTAGVVARGDIITGQTATPKWTRLAKGAANQVLSMDATGTDVVWTTPSSGAGDVVFVATPANFAINNTTDVTIVTRDVTGVAAGTQLIVEATF